MLCSLSALALAPSYRIVDLGLPPSTRNVEAIAINNRGEVLAKTNERGYLWRDGLWISLGEPTTSAGSGDPARLRPEGLNDFGIVVGGQGSLGPVFMSGLEFSEAFIWRGRGIENLKAGSTTSASAINNLGDVVGGDGQQAFARLRGKIVGLPQASHVEPRDPSGEMGDVNRASAIAINDRRQILMDSTFGGKHGDTDLPSRPFLVDGRTKSLRMAPVALPKGFGSATGLDLNGSGAVLALAHNGDYRRTMLYLVAGGRIARLALPGTGNVVSHADMNNRGDVVCTIAPLIDQERRRPALWLHSQSVAFPKFARWTLQTATGINDRGVICGSGLHEGKARTFVLVPFAGFGEGGNGGHG